MYLTELDGGPDANKGVGGPARCEEAAKRCTSLNWTVGPTLIKRREIMKTKLVLLVLLGTLTYCAALYAHHSFAALYDEKATVKVEGKILQFSFRSPHSFLAIEAPDKDGKVQRWAVTWASPAQLTRAGVTRDFFKAGDHVIVTGNPGRNAEDHLVRMVTLARPADGFNWGGREGQVVD